MQQNASPQRSRSRERKPMMRRSYSRSPPPQQQRRRYSPSPSNNAPAPSSSYNSQQQADDQHYQQAHKRSRLGSKEEHREARHYRDTSPEHQRRRRFPDKMSNQTVDRHGNRPSNRLFIDRLPQDTTEGDVRQFFAEFEKYIASVKLGTKPLKPGEYRTCIVSMINRDAAVDAREKLIGYDGPKDKQWKCAMLINFAKPRIEDKSGGHHHHGSGYHSSAQHPPAPFHSGDYSPHHYSGGPPAGYYNDSYGNGGPRQRSPSPSRHGYHRRRSPYGRRSPSPSYRRREYSPKYGGPPPVPMAPYDPVMSLPQHLHFDKMGNPASSVLNVVNFSVYLKKEDVFRMFPNAREVEMSIQKSKHGEFNVAYLFYDDVVTAAKERDRMFGFKDDVQPHGLLINYSSRKPLHYAPPPYGMSPPRSSGNMDQHHRHQYPPSPVSYRDDYRRRSRRYSASPPQQQQHGQQSPPPQSYAAAPVSAPAVYNDAPAQQPLPEGSTDSLRVDAPARYDRRDIEELFLGCKGLSKVTKEDPGTFVVSFQSVAHACNALDMVSHKLKRENKSMALSFFK